MNRLLEMPEMTWLPVGTDRTELYAGRQFDMVFEVPGLRMFGRANVTGRPGETWFRMWSESGIVTPEPIML